MLGYGTRGPDLSRVLSKDPELTRGLDLKKLTRKPVPADVAERIRPGATDASIDEFMRAREAAATKPKQPSSLLSCILRFGRG